jgi:hypothetical protein
MIIPGWILSGVGAMNLALIPVCHADFYPKEQSDLCVTLSIGVGIVGLGVGVPLLAVGYSKRHTYKEWRSRHPVLSQLGQTQVALQNSSALVVYRGTF